MDKKEHRDSYPGWTVLRDIYLEIGYSKYRDSYLGVNSCVAIYSVDLYKAEISVQKWTVV